ncbi:YggS family pyridoxal phosphate-dependent enzyme [Clostridium sp. MD294]|uniref:YggS family pyridoxal phosphate-dependent enzyme n=1 Tax=Clostridium sp. MD294 TaxID=97138 RepID=UPI0002CCBA00|nr:YggS family pyridoxal phosphate-dependent enzyme [Clostridium sp. MD294]NDO46776.1 YggS family pyridoxal phosphate-dependent enzyme [Clostridium sp. MD294]USF28782.1 Pyridoxal phosphate homeostasis protein [Clostridium sp. MD294]
MDEIKQNIAEIEKRIATAVQKSGRKREDVLLLAVSKTIDVEHIKQAVDCGLKELGENRVQEILEKYEPMGKEVCWHLIGHLQTNKVKYIIDKVKMIHSVDSIKLAEEISKRAKQANVNMDILVEVNMAGEESKFGVSPEQTLSFIQNIAFLDNISVKGLMTVAPFVDNPEENRDCFRRMKQLLVDINSEKIDNVHMNVLSMGMSNDFEVAIEEGATIVRVGTNIFGKRVYPQK